MQTQFSTLSIHYMSTDKKKIKITWPQYLVETWDPVLQERVGQGLSDFEEHADPATFLRDLQRLQVVAAFYCDAPSKVDQDQAEVLFDWVCKSLVQNDAEAAVALQRALDFALDDVPFEHGDEGDTLLTDIQQIYPFTQSWEDAVKYLGVANLLPTPA